MLIKQFFVLGLCALFIACGATTNERGISSTTTDSTASGSAYNSSDGFAPASPTAVPKAPALNAPADTAAAGTTPASTTIAQPASTATPAASPQAAATPVVAAKPAAVDNSADIKRGEALISKSDCLACHKIDGKLLGPSYKDVAAKYPNNAATIAQLAGKIKSGGSGVWGAIPMSPHPALSDDDAKSMVRYIMSLK